MALVVGAAADCRVEVERETRDLRPTLVQPQPGHSAAPAVGQAAGLAGRDLERRVRASDARRSPRPGLGTRAGSVWPRKTSVRCSLSADTQRVSGKADAQRLEASP